VTSKSLTNEAIDNLGWQATVMGANLLLKAVVLILLARSMPPVEFGLIAASTVVISLAADFSQMGVHRALIQRLTLDRAHIGAAGSISLLTGMLAAAALYWAAPWLADLLGIVETRPLIEFLALTLVLTGISEVSASLLQRERRFRDLGLIDLGSYFFGFACVALPLAGLDYGAWALAIGQMAQVISRLAALFLVRMPVVSLVPNWKESKDLLIPGAGFSAGQVGNYLATQADYFIVGRLLGAEALGFYSRAYQFFMLPAQMFGKVTATVLFPTFSSIQDQRDRIARAYLFALGATAIITLPVSAVLVILAPETISFLLGDAWEGMILPFQVLVVTLMFRTSYKLSDAVVLATGSMFQRAQTQFLYAAAVAGGALAGIQFGLPGVAAGVGLAVLLNYAMTLWLARRNTGLSWKAVLTSQFRQLPGAFLIAIPVWVAVEVGRQYGMADFAILIVGGLTGTMAAMIAWTRLRPIYGSDGASLYALVLAKLSRIRRPTATSSSGN
jgi:PST family polysaccharide transporter